MPSNSTECPSHFAHRMRDLLDFDASIADTKTVQVRFPDCVRRERQCSRQVLEPDVHYIGRKRGFTDARGEVQAG